MSATVSPKANSWSVMVHYQPTYIVIITLTHASARTDTVHIETRSSPSSVVISMVKLPPHQHYRAYINKNTNKLKYLSYFILLLSVLQRRILHFV